MATTGSETRGGVRRFDGRVAAVTVAGSGIGRALALELARRHAHLALSDVDEQGLGETADACRGFPVNVTAQRVDVAQREQVYAAAERVVADHGRVHLIVSNAGVGLGATVEGMSYADFEWLMAINFWGVCMGRRPSSRTSRPRAKGTS